MRWADKTTKKAGREHDDPRYIVDLVKRFTRVSVETMKIVDSFPSPPRTDCPPPLLP